MNASHGPLVELRELLTLLHNDEMTQQQESRIEQLVVEDVMARQFYLEMMFLYGHLKWRHQYGIQCGEELPEEEESIAMAEITGMEYEAMETEGGFTPPVSASIAEPQPRIVITPTLGSYISSDLTLGMFLFSYAVAAVITGFALLAAGLITMPSYRDIADQFARSTANRSDAPHFATHPNGADDSDPAAPQRKTIGQVTGLVDCHWSNSQTAAHLRCRIAVGDEFVLASGLVEITYDTGAKVLLQGPVTYQVDSPHGGLLLVGKLTARVEKKGDSSQKSNPQSSISNPALFVVRTPTAVVTDLGTEFGVEVSNTGETRSHVFRGSVQLQQTGVAEGKESPHNTIILHANEAASVRIQHGVTEKADKENKLVLSRSEFNATAFVLPGGMRQYVEEQHLKPLRRWQAYSQQLRKDPTLVAYYPFEKMASDASTSVLPNRSAVGSELDGNVPGGEWVDGRLPGKMALYFHGLGSGDCVQLPHPERFEFSDAFSIAVWFKAHANHFPYGTMLVTKGEHSWRLLYSGEPSPLGFHTNNANVPVRRNGYYQETNGHTNIVDHRWHLAVAVYEPQNDKVAQKRLYIDGRLDAENMAPMPREQSKSPVWLGANSDAPNQVFSGLIDEVAFFSRALSAEEITAMFRAGNPESCESETQ